jgi:hypothetical protein
MQCFGGFLQHILFLQYHSNRTENGFTLSHQMSILKSQIEVPI